MVAGADARRAVALLLVLLTAVSTTPVFAADFSKTTAPLGSVSTVGAVELRGVTISQEGTIFSGDHLRSREKAYAKVSLGSRKIEIGERTDLVFSRDVNQVRIAMTSGSIGFSAAAKDPLTITVKPYVIAASQADSGSVAFVNGGAAIGVRAVDGAVTITNAKTHTSFQLVRGEERILGLNGGTPAPSLTELASSVPSPVPLPNLDPSGNQAPSSGGSAPAGAKPCKYCMDKGTWLSLAAGLGIGVTAITALVVAEHNKTDNKNNAAAIAGQAAQLKALSNVQSLQNTAQQASSSASQVASTAIAVNGAIAASGISAATKATLTAQATTLQSQAQASVQQIAALQAQLQSLQSQLATTSDSSVIAGISAQILTVNANLGADINVLNNTINQLNALITAARAAGVPNVPSLTVQPVAPPTVASLSVPT